MDWDENVLTLDAGDPVAFDGLIIAAGAGTNFFGVPGAAEHSFPLYSLADAPDAAQPPPGAGRARRRRTRTTPTPR